MALMLRIDEFPESSNRAKATIFLKNFAGKHNIDISFINNDHNNQNGFFFDVKVARREDIEKFSSCLPPFDFGNCRHRLKVSPISMQTSQEFSDQIPKRITNPFHEVTSHGNSSTAKIQIKSPILLLNKIHSWTDIENVSEFSNQRAIVVSGNDPSTELDETEILEYLQDYSTSGGGPVRMMVLMHDGILVIFYYEKASEAVISRGKIHNINKKQMKISSKEVPPLHKDQILVEMEPTSILQQDDLRMALASWSKNETSPSMINKGSNKTVDRYIAHYDTPLDEENFMSIIRNSKGSETELGLKVMVLPKTDCIAIKGLRFRSVHRLRFFLESSQFNPNRARTTKINVGEGNTVLAYFQSYKEVEDGLKSHKDVFTFENQDLQLLPYYHDLSDIHDTLTSENWSETYLRRRKGHELEALSFDYCDQKEEILEFIAKRPHQLKKLQDKMSKVAKLEIVTHHHFYIRVTPIKEIGQWKNKCLKDLQNFFSSYILETQYFDIERLKKIRSQNEKVELNPDGFDEKENDCALRWTGKDAEILMVYGVASAVKQAVQYIKDLISTHDDKMSIPYGKYIWLENSQEFTRLNKKYDCKISWNRKERKLEFDGTEKAKLDLFAMIEPVREQRLDFEDKYKRNLLKGLQRRQDELKKFAHELLQGFQAIVIFDGSTPVIWCYRDVIADAVEKFKDSLVANNPIISLDQPMKKALTISEWTDEKKVIENELWVLITIENDQLQIAGFKKDISEALDRIHKFFGAYAIYEGRINMEIGEMRYLQHFCKEFKRCCDIKRDDVDIEFDLSGIKLTGTKYSLEEALRIIKGIQILNDRSCHNYCGIKSYFEEDRGKKDLNHIMKEAKCFITIEDGEKKESVRPTVQTDQSFMDTLRMRDNEFKKIHEQKLADKVVQDPSQSYTGAIGSLRISVKFGDITKDGSDIIVNSTGSDFNLSVGMVSKNLLQKCGSQLQEELNQHTEEDMRLTSGRNLPCKNILHVVFPDSIEKMKRCMKEILLRSEQISCRSLALPAVGTGNKDMKSADVARMLREAIFEFVNEHPSLKYLKEISVVIFDQMKFDQFYHELILQDAKIHEDPIPLSSSLFERILQSMRAKPNLTPIAVKVQQGDITESKTDAIVNSIGSGFNLNDGSISKAILNKGGAQLQSELSKLTNAKIRVTSGGKLPCNKIIHAVFQEKLLRETLQEIFVICDATGCKTASLPALGTGNLKISPASVAQTIKQAISDFSKSSDCVGNLKEVTVVIFENSKIDEFSRCLLNTPDNKMKVLPKITMDSPKPRPRITPFLQNTRKIGDVRLILTKGDIIESKTDAIVNSCNGSFDLSRGQVSQLILKKGGEEVQKQVLSCKGSIRKTFGGNLACRKIFHVTFPSRKDEMKQQILNLLQQVNKEGCQSLSMPAIGTGNLGMKVTDVAEAMTNAITEWIATAPSYTVLKEIRLVVHEKTMFNEFQKDLFPSDNIDICTTNPMAMTSDSNQEEIPSRKKVSEKIVFCYYAEQKNVLEKAKKKVKHTVEQRFAKETIKIPNFDKFMKWKKKDLEKFLSDLKYSYRQKTQGDRDIEIEGIREKVEKAQAYIAKGIQEVANVIENYSLGNYLWRYQYSNKDTWNEFDELSSKNLEKAYKEGISGNCYVFIEKMVVCCYNVQNMEIAIGRTRIKVLRETRGDFPKHWEQMHSDQTYKLVKLNETDVEYKDAVAKLSTSVKIKSIQSISRVQNKTLFLRFQPEKERITRICRRRVVAQHLFHGTDADTADKIASGSQGFDRGRAGSANAAAYGKGTYFAKDASYSNRDKYAKPDATGVKTIILAEVITGEYCQGSADLTALSNIHGSSECYNCAVDNIENPTIFVIFSDVAAYPAYIIKYKS